jgi:chromate transport protein ChrA
MLEACAGTTRATRATRAACGRGAPGATVVIVLSVAPSFVVAFFFVLFIAHRFEELTSLREQALQGGLLQ